MRKRTPAAALFFGALLAATSLAAAGRAPVSAGLAERDPNQYVAFGDSITYGLGFYGYPPRLQALLAAKYGVARVWNEGLGGETTADGLVRIDSVLAGTSSKFILLMEGANDARNLQVSITTAAENLLKMCQKSLEANMTPLLATITPWSDWYWYDLKYRTRLDDLNDRIRQIAFDLGIPLVDAFEAFMAYPDGYEVLLVDGLHPNSTGYDLLAEAWFAALKIVKFDPPLPPVLPALETKLDATETRKINTVTWEANPGNAGRELKGYVVYRKPAGSADAEFVRIGSTGASVFRYEDGPLEVSPKYAYRVTALSSVSDESAPTATVTETAVFVFPPLYPAVRTLPVRLARPGAKSNVVTFRPNPLNAAALVAGYRVYRKRDGEDDGAFAEIATLGTGTHLLTDPFVPAGVRYVYAVSTLFAEGLESKKSVSVTAR